MEHSILLLEDEPLILMDLEFAAEDQGCTALPTPNCDEALAIIASHGKRLTAAILDVSLGQGKTCFPVAHALDRLGVPYILHSGDLDRHDENIRTLKAALIAKPAPAHKVIAAAIAHATEAATRSAGGTMNTADPANA